MAVRQCVIEASPEEVWDVLADGRCYSEWVVGTSDTRPLDEDWPAVGAEIEYTISVGRWAVSGRTTVRFCEPPRHLELEAESGRLGTARIALDVRPWGDRTLVILDEHPLRGPGGAVGHNVLVNAFTQLRHRGMLRRLTRCVQNRRAART